MYIFVSEYVFMCYVVITCTQGMKSTVLVRELVQVYTSQLTCPVQTSDGHIASLYVHVHQISLHYNHSVYSTLHCKNSRVVIFSCKTDINMQQKSIHVVEVLCFCYVHLEPHAKVQVTILRSCVYMIFHCMANHALRVSI